MKFYVFPFATFNACKVTFAAELLGVDYELVVVDPTKGEHRGEDFSKLNAFGRIPVMQDGDLTISESAAITRYLSAKHGDSLYGKNPQEKAQTDQWIDRFCIDIGPVLTVYVYEELLGPMIMKRQPDLDKIAVAAKTLKRYLPIVEGQLEGKTYLLGEEISLADVVGFAYVASTENTSLSLADYPNITRWAKALDATEAWQRMKGKYLSFT